jgi:hypothetical protein
LSPISQKTLENRTTNPTAVVDGIDPPTPAYVPPLNATPSFDNGLLDNTRMHGQSEIPLSSMHPEDDRASVQVSEAHTEALPAYKADHAPVYSPRRRDSKEPVTWSMIAFRLGFVFPPFWLCGALTLITPPGSMARIFMPWFKDFAPSDEFWCHDDLPQADKEAYLARMRAAEIRWGKRSLFALSLVMSFIVVVAVIIVAVTKAD